MLGEGVAHAFAKNAKIRLTHLATVPAQHQLEMVPEQKENRALEHQLEMVPEQKENRALDPDTGRLPLTTLSCEDT